MKLRSLLIYMVVLVLAGSWYAWDTINKDKKVAAEKAGKKVFSFQTGQVSAYELQTKGGKPLKVEKKDGGWVITEPVKLEADEAAILGIIGSAGALEKTRDVGKADNLARYGLDPPLATVRLNVDGKWVELQLGENTPVGDATYAKGGNLDGVFLLPADQAGILKRGPQDLRRRRLVSAANDQVTALTVQWEDGAKVHVERRADGLGWTAPEKPSLPVKTSKVENVLDQIEYLRAGKFLAEGLGNLAQYGLEPANVVVTLRLKDGKESRLLLGKPGDAPRAPLKAASSELDAVVEIEGGIHRDLPRDLARLEDRSLAVFTLDDVTEVSWKVAGAGGTVVKIDKDTWGVPKKDGKPSAVKDPWRVRGLLWDLGDLEYESRADGPAPPAEPYGRLDYKTKGGGGGSVLWENPGEAKEPVAAWVTEAGKPHAVKVKPDILKKLQGRVGEIPLEEKK